MTRTLEQMLFSCYRSFSEIPKPILPAAKVFAELFSKSDRSPLQNPPKNFNLSGRLFGFGFDVSGGFFGEGY